MDKQNGSEAKDHCDIVINNINNDEVDNVINKRSNVKNPTYENVFETVNDGTTPLYENYKRVKTPTTINKHNKKNEQLKSVNGIKIIPKDAIVKKKSTNDKKNVRSLSNRGVNGRDLKINVVKNDDDNVNINDTKKIVNGGKIKNQKIIKEDSTKGTLIKKKTGLERKITTPTLTKNVEKNNGSLR